MTASGLYAPLYICVSAGLTKEELSPELCPDGILPVKVPGLCRGGGDLFNEGGFGWLVFLRADKKDNKSDQDAAYLSIGNKKYIHYNDDCYMPWIGRIREALGLEEDQEPPD